MMLVGGLLFLVSGLSLEIASSQQAVLVAEPVKVVLRWKAATDLPRILIDDPNFGKRTVSFVVDDGTGPRRYREQSRSFADVVIQPGSLAKGEEVVVNHVLLTGSYDGKAAGPVFAVPGTYRVKAAYDGPGVDQPVESNVLTFTVTAPGGDEQVVAEMLAKEPLLRAGEGRLERIQEVVGAHPASRHLAWTKVRLAERRADELNNRYDPDTGESFWRLDPAALASALAPRYHTMAVNIFGDSWGPFEEERLAQVMTYARAAGDRQLEQQARDQLLADFPTSMAAVGVREREAGLAEAAIEDRETDDTQPPTNDKTPPTLVVGTSPSTLWPPNHKMVGVTVTVNVKDNVDPNPTVKLVSITCDDGCDPSADVAGAAMNTDERQFQLRAERLGTGFGRTYTITYSATDASGNSSTKATTVTVPHDQGKK
jgi:hypothetical protein